MHPLVRDLYRRFLHVGRDYPKGYAFVREKARTAILANKDVTGEDELMRAVYKGRWWVNELIGVVKLKKYRAMRQRYGAGEDPVQLANALERRLEEDSKAAATPSSPRQTTTLQ